LPGRWWDAAAVRGESVNGDSPGYEQHMEREQRAQPPLDDELEREVDSLTHGSPVELRIESAIAPAGSSP
jgi:hypothetical protein